MNHSMQLARWLTIAALADWLLARTLSRSAIFMPKSPPLLTAYQALTTIGQVANTLAGLLALAALLWLAWQAQREAKPALAYTLLGVAVLSVVSLVVAPAGWMLVVYHVLVLLALALIGWLIGWDAAHRHAAERTSLLAWGAVAAAIAVGELYQLSSALAPALQLSQPLPFTTTLFVFGEFCVVVGGFALWWAYGRALVWRWMAAALLPALAFVAVYLANAELASVMAIWSMGLTLYLPWVFYALSLWLTAAVVFAARPRADGVMWAVLLLIAGGYAPQISTQAFFLMMAVWLLARAPAAQPSPLHRLSISPALHRS